VKAPFLEWVMSKPDDLSAALQQATAEAIALKSPLRERLQYIAEAVRRLSPSFAETVDSFVARLHKAEAGAAAPRVGDLFPDFILPDQNGRIIRLSALLADGPVVIAFLRGHWCPYCQTTAAALSEIADAAQSCGGQIVAITPESRRFSRRLAEDSHHRFPILTDVDNGFALSLNLAIWIDDGMAQLILGAGWNIPFYQTANSWVLPIPATFVVTGKGRVAARYVSPDYRTRMEIADILEALRAVGRAPA
jgi:peroxiredoxin